ncbi:PIN domain-containing protein [Holophaga foetida]|uniref:PIN domain-containing protein n=1 Tax=Holophaga foetida TaxID=35839 RepID=UPI00024742C5|nr:type II toxin-antitoxin system VapC family toxin [Holophaga foetida]
MRAADTNVLIRLIEQDDPAQLALAESAVAEGPLWVSLLVILEMVWVLEAGYGRSKPEITRVLDILTSNRDLVLEAPELVRAALDLWGKGTADFSDYLILEATRAAGHSPLLTFDKRLAKASGAQKV